MTIAVVSGVPGAGKTIWTLQHVEALRIASGRPVYQHGIDGLSLDWNALEDPRDWEKLPHGSIVVIDEAYKIFPKAGPGMKVPDWMEKLAEHRHLGMDFFLLSQNAGLQLHHFVRGLVGEHYHLSRKFNSHKARLFKFEGLKDPNDYHAKKAAVVSWFSYPKEFFRAYQSASVHTMHRTIPWKMVVPALVGVIAVPLLVWFALHGLSDSADAGTEKVVGEGGKVPLEGRQSQVGPTVQLHADSFTERVPGIPYSAPVYAQGVHIVDAPKVAGCGVLRIGHTTTCKCNSQQGHTLDLDKRTCMAYFERGSFDPAGKVRYPVIEPYVPPLAPVEQGPGSGADAVAPRPANTAQPPSGSLPAA